MARDEYSRTDGGRSNGRRIDERGFFLLLQPLTISFLIFPFTPFSRNIRFRFYRSDESMLIKR